MKTTIIADKLPCVGVKNKHHPHFDVSIFSPPVGEVPSLAFAYFIFAGGGARGGSAGKATNPARFLLYPLHISPAIMECMRNEVVQIDQNILGGTPCFAGTRVPTRSLFDHLKLGYSINGFLEQFPTLKREQVEALLEQSCEQVEERARHLVGQ